MATLLKLSTPALRFLAASAIALGLVPLSANAQSARDSAPHYQRAVDAAIPPHFKALNLSKEQEEKLQAIEATHQELMRKNMDKLRANRVAEREIVEAPSFNEKKAEKLSAQDAEIMRENNLATLRFRHEIYQILTPEQRTKLSDMRKQHQPMRRSPDAATK